VSAPAAFDLFDPQLRADPYPAVAHLRESGDGVQRVEPGFWLVGRHGDVQHLHRDSRLGRDPRKSALYPLVRPFLAGSDLERCVESWMFFSDPPDHTRLRRLAAMAFTPRAVDAMCATIEALADELIAELPSTGEVDLIPAFAQPFPVRVMLAILDLPTVDYDALKEWSDAVALVVEPIAGRGRLELADAAVREFNAYLADHIARRRHTPRSGLLDDLITAESEGDRLSEEELLAMLVLLFVAGHETTTNLLGNGLLALARHPDQWQRLRVEPALIHSAVEELLRFDGPANSNLRITLEELTVGTTTIPSGEIVFCWLGAANRDPRAFADPDTLDVARSPNPHVTFGGGAHFCLGAALARIEAAVALHRLTVRWRTLAVDEAGVRWRDLINIRGLETLTSQVAGG
jgi:cytochrome P450